MIVIVDYGAGNLGSVDKAFNYIGEKAVIVSDPDLIARADRLVLPGVGAFGEAAEKLAAGGFDQAILEHIRKGKPFLGICLGLQLLFEASSESPGARGLAVLEGSINMFPRDMGLKVPQIGWNSVNIKEGSRLFKDIPSGTHFYFVHSYYLRAEDPAIACAVCEYGLFFDAAVERDNVFAVQFHPEKSGRAGLQLLRNFSSI